MTKKMTKIDATNMLLRIRNKYDFNESNKFIIKLIKEKARKINMGALIEQVASRYESLEEFENDGDFEKVFSFVVLQQYEGLEYGICLELLIDSHEEIKAFLKTQLKKQIIQEIKSDLENGKKDSILYGLEHIDIAVYDDNDNSKLTSLIYKIEDFDDNGEVVANSDTLYYVSDIIHNITVNNGDIAADSIVESAIDYLADIVILDRFYCKRCTAS
jgi:hypothetical protein